MPILDWLDRDKHTKAADAVPYRLLETVDELSYGDADSANMLIQGDNLEALKALLPYYAGQVKCIFIDPPYNTLSANFEYYDDSLEHSQWLSMIYPRLEYLRGLLTEDGSIWVTIDDNEAHYMKVVMDEIFGRKNFVCTIIWEKRKSRENRRVFSFKHDYVLVYAKNKNLFEQIRNPIAMNEAVLARYRNPDNDPRGAWQSVAITAQAGHGTASQFYTITTPSGRKINPPAGNCWRYTQHRLQELIADDRIYFGADGGNVPRLKKLLSESEDAGLTPETIWYADDVGTNDTAKRHSNILFEGSGFDSPKPEELLKRIIEIASNPSELVLDSFLGSGTTAAVAHKIGRKYIGIEVGDHAVTHCAPRLKKVIGGERGGISEAVGWRGGGGFRFYKLGPSIFDEAGNINPKIRFPHLAAHIWFCETKTAYQPGKKKSPLLGIHDDVAYYLLYNGILGDKTVNGGNVLTQSVLKDLPPHKGRKVIYGETSRITPDRLKALNIVFKQTPYDVKAS